MWEVINFFLLLLLVIVVIGVLLLSIFYYYKIKSYVDDTISHLGSLIPMFNEYEFKDINYNSIDDMKESDFTDISFNKKLAIFLCNINMTTYNIFSDYNTGLSEEIQYLHTINNNCYIYKYKKYIIISYRGTKTGDDVITDLDSIQTEMAGYSDNILVHRGFYRLWSPYKDEIKTYIKKNFNNKYQILITGHSLGCASAIFTALLLSSSYNIKLYMFAPPRIGNQHLIKKLDTDIPNNFAIINIPDLIPNLPPITLTTIGNTWLYDNFTNRYLIDYQLGSIVLNHRLDTYICGLQENQPFCKEPIWARMPTLITSNI